MGGACSTYGEVTSANRGFVGEGKGKGPSHEVVWLKDKILRTQNVQRMCMLWVLNVWPFNHTT
jgi:hypothetical protein